MKTILFLAFITALCFSCGNNTKPTSVESENKVLNHFLSISGDWDGSGKQTILRDQYFSRTNNRIQLVSDGFKDLWIKTSK